MTKETNKSDALKKELQTSADKYKQQLEDDLNHSVDDIKRIGKYSLILGAASLICYAVVRYFTDEDGDKETIREREKDARPTIIEELVKAGTEIGAVYLLSFAKSKLKDYIKDLTKLENNDNGLTSGTHTEENRGD